MSPYATGTAKPPALVLGLTEAPRALSELVWFLGVQPWLARRFPGDGRPVLVIPGLNAGDWSTRPLRRLLERVGYVPYGWGLGTDIGPTAKAIAGLDELLTSITKEHGRPVSLIGQSLGGYLGAELARRNPGAIDRLITLAGPMNMTDLHQSRAGNEYAKHARQHLPEYDFEVWRSAPRPDIPSTSIFSRFDGIVSADASRYPRGPLHENIEVVSSHLGMAVQPAAVYAVLDRLAAPVDQWRRFQAPRRFRAYFPTDRHTA